MTTGEVERSTWRPPLRIRTAHPLLALTLLAGLCLAACGGSSGNPTGTDDDDTEADLSIDYEAIAGEWSGEVGVRNWGIVEVTKSEADDVGERIGKVWELKKKGGEARCRAPIYAMKSDPPTYWADAPEDEVGNCRPATFRFEHDPEAGTLEWYYRPYDESDYSLAGTLTREGG